MTAVAARRLPARTRTRTIAAGWASHAAFDMTHRRGPDSRIPDWYPGLCAGYDVVIAALVLARR